MFGLMKPRGCSKGPEAAAHRRMHYCGTCKTMGKLYGQRSRMLLNNDAVFLAELLSAIGPENGTVASWNSAYKSYNCASLPKTEAEMPIALQYASAATLVMSEMKLRDQLADHPGAGLKLIGKLYSEPFYTASRRLHNWGLSVQRIQDLCAAQPDLERTTVSHQTQDVDAESILNALSDPTSQMTAMVFERGAAAVGAGDTAQTAMRRLGEKFGELIYLIDAFEDDRKDARKGEFNAFQAAYGSPGIAVCGDETLRSRAMDTVLEIASLVRSRILELPISPDAARMYSLRLGANVAEKLGIVFEEAMCNSSRSCSTGKSKASRIKNAREVAVRLTEQHRSECAGAVGAMKAPLVFAAVLCIAMLFPRQAMATNSYREIVGMLFNLMFWGAALNTVLAMPQRLVARRFAVESGPNVNFMDRGVTHSHSQDGGHTTVVTTTRVRRRRPCCCDACACECCCDGCCDACDCACCTCEACECASCACDSCSGC